MGGLPPRSKASRDHKKQQSTMVAADGVVPVLHFERLSGLGGRFNDSLIA